jgi:hypothetical protein
MLTKLQPDVTLAQVRLAMAEEEKQRAEEGLIAAHNVSAGAFLLLGTEIQSLQCVSYYYNFGSHLILMTDKPFVWKSVVAGSRRCCKQHPWSNGEP